MHIYYCSKEKKMCTIKLVNVMKIFFFLSSFAIGEREVSESDVTCGQVWLPILGICALHLTHPKCTHTAVNTHTHTHREHTPGAVDSQCCGARGAVGGSVSCSRASQSWY